MNGSQPNKMIVVYVKKTGHVVAAVSRNSNSGTSPSLADIVGDALTVRGAANNAAPTPGVIGSFMIPQGDLLSTEVDFGLVGTYPWGHAVQLPDPATNPGNSTPQIRPGNLTPLATPTISGTTSISSPTLKLSVADPNPFYIIVAPEEPSNTGPSPLSGVLSPVSGSSSVALPALPAAKYLVLILVQNMLPYVFAYTVT
jgi:hypothetical protein